MSVDDMRAALGLGPEVSDADVVTAWDAHLASLPPAPTTATPTELKQRYPAFAAVSTDTISYWLTDALFTVNEGWGVDANRAQMALTAHNMTVNAVPGIAKTEAENLPAGVTRFRSASMDVAVSESAANRSIATGYGSTRYGEEFRVFLRRHVGGPRLVGCA